MKEKEFDGWVYTLLEKAERVQKSKQPAYTGDDIDVLKNFKTIAEQLGLTPMQIWGVYFYKHVSALMSYAKDHNIHQAEDIDGRVVDCLNYLKLGYGLIVEEREENRLGNDQPSTPQLTTKSIAYGMDKSHISDGRTH